VSDQLAESLRSLVHQYGFRQVSQALDKIQSPEPSGSHELPTSEPPRGRQAGVPKGQRVKLTASRHVAKLELPSGKLAPVAELARRFDEKAFLPSFGDIAHFCESYGVDEPSSKSRASAIPRIFKAIAEMEIKEIQRIVDDGMFSGPSRLGPIADAIRNRAKVRAATHRDDVLA